MRLIRLVASLVLVLCVPTYAQDKSDKLTVQGKLTRLMAMGAETSGWAIELNPALDVRGKQVSSIEIVYLDSKKLEALVNKSVKASGFLSNATGIETGQRPVLNVTSIKAIKQKIVSSTPTK
jgi:hypothetical protein